MHIFRNHLKKFEVSLRESWQRLTKTFFQRIFPRFVALFYGFETSWALFSLLNLLGNVEQMNLPSYFFVIIVIVARQFSTGKKRTKF